MMYVIGLQQSRAQWLLRELPYESPVQLELPIAKFHHSSSTTPAQGFKYLGLFILRSFWPYNPGSSYLKL